MRKRAIYLCREHVQVGDEYIHGACLDELTAMRWAERMRARTGTKNYDVVTMYDGEIEVRS